MSTTIPMRVEEPRTRIIMNKRVNWLYIIQHIPVLFAFIAPAYAVYGFTLTYFPTPVAVTAGMAFELFILGALSMTDQFASASKLSWVIFCITNGFALVSSVLSQLLFYVGDFTQVTLESLVHAVPFSACGILYNMLLFSLYWDLLKKYDTICKEFPFECSWCGKRYGQKDESSYKKHLAYCKRHNGSA